LHIELISIQIRLVDGSNFQLSPSAGLDRLGNIHHLVIVEIKPGNGVVALRLEMFFFNAAGFSLGIKRHHAIALGVLHMVGKLGSAY
jgi:hypothetical protein